MKLGYIVSAYKLPDQLVRLVSRLDNGTSHFLIHVDKKTDETVFRRMREPLRHLTNVHVLERHRCPYGGFGHVTATLKGTTRSCGSGGGSHSDFDRSAAPLTGACRENASCPPGRDTSSSPV